MPPVTPRAEADPWLEDPRANDPAHSFDVPLDTRTGPEHIADLGRIAEDHPELQTGLVREPAPPKAPVTPTPVDEDQPETFEVEGGTVTIEHDSKGWHGTLSLDDGGGDEVFHGKTQKELMTRVLAGKVKATAQIRKLNRKLKVGGTVQAPAPVLPENRFEPRQLNANDIFEIKTALESDPDKAADLRFQKKYNMTESEFVSRFLATEKKAIKGEEAADELTIEGVSKEFLEKNKNRYYPWEENAKLVCGWLCKNKLGRSMTTADNFGTVSAQLLARGLYTLENLEEALEDLEDSGLLLPPPEAEPEVEPEIEPEVPPAPAPRPARQVDPAPQNPRIVSSKRQPRGGLGIRSGTIVTPTPEEPRAPSVDEMENMSTAELSELLNQTRKLARTRR